MVFSLSKSNKILEEALRFFPIPFIIHILPKTVILFSEKSPWTYVSPRIYLWKFYKFEEFYTFEGTKNATGVQ